MISILNGRCLQDSGMGLLAGAALYLYVSILWPSFASSWIEALLLPAVGAGILFLFSLPGLTWLSRTGYAVGGGSMGVILALLWIEGFHPWLTAGFFLGASSLGLFLTFWLESRGIGSRWIIVAAVGLLTLGWLQSYLRQERVDEDSTRLVILGLDAGTWTVIDALAAKGELPALQSLQTDGASGVLRVGEYPALSPRVWTTIATGKPPRLHGIQGFFSTQNDLRVPRLQEILAERGLTIGSFQWLLTWPPIEQPDFIVPGWMARDARTFPESFSFVKELELAFQTGNQKAHDPGSLKTWAIRYLENGLRLSTCLRIGMLAVKDIWLSSGWEKDYAAKRRIQLLLNGDLVVEIFKRYEPGYLSAVFYGTDNLAHKFWKYLYPKDFGIDESEAAPYSELLLNYYREADRVIGRLLRLLPSQTLLLVVSDHGYSSWPADQEHPLFPSTRTTAAPKMTALVELAGLQIPNDVSIASVAQEGYALFMGEDTQKRESMDAMLDLLSRLRLPGSEESVFLAKEIGPFQLEITAAAHAQDVGVSKVDTPTGEVPLSDLVEIEDRSGYHSVEGILMMKGPNVRPGFRVARAHQVDIVPTVLYLLGFPVGQDMTGEILESVIDPGFFSRNPPRFIPSYDPLVPLEKLDESQGDRKELEERLRALGYLN